MKKNLILVSILTLGLVLGTSLPASASDAQKIVLLEKRVKVLETQLKRLLEQEKRASKYLKCVQNVEGNSFVVPFKILNCIRK